MTIQGIDHIEMYVGDARQTAYFLCTAFGMRVRGQGGPETGLVGQRSLLLGQGDIRILLTTGLTPDHPAAEYVSLHGDGVAVVGLATDDLATTYQQAVEGGAESLAAPSRHQPDGSARRDGAAGGDCDVDVVALATVRGFGDVAHRLVQRTGPGRQFWPGAIEMIAADPDAGDGLLEIVDHLAVCLPAGELGPATQRYKDAFGFTEIFSEYVEIGDQGMESRVVQSPSGGVTLTLLQPDVVRQRGQLDDFLAWHGGAGVQHIAFRTDDIVAAVRTFSARGVGFAATPASYYEVLEQRLGPIELPVAELKDVGVLVDRDHWGQMFQIFTQSMHVRRTLFLELIERRGARTFGTSNIHALYEAKERELAGERSSAEA